MTGTGSRTSGGSSSSTGGSTGAYAIYDTLSGTFQTLGLDGIGLPHRPGMDATLSGAVELVEYPPEPAQTWGVVMLGQYGIPIESQASVATTVESPGGYSIAIAIETPPLQGMPGVPNATTLTCDGGGLDITLWVYGDAGYNRTDPLLETYSSALPGASCTLTLDTPTFVGEAILTYFFAHGTLSATLTAPPPDGGSYFGTPGRLLATW